MKNLREVNLSNTALTLSDVHVTSAILPKKTSELATNIATSGEVLIEGPVYANNMEVSSGNLKTLGALYCNNELHVKNDFEGELNFTKAVAAAKSIAALLTTSMAIFGSDLNAPSVKLKNAFVAGASMARRLLLKIALFLGEFFRQRALWLLIALLELFVR